MLVAVLVISGVALAMSACGGGGQQGEEQATKARPLPETNKALSPGEYRSEEFKPSLSFHVGKGWINVAPELADKLSISPSREQAAPLLIFRNLQQVYDPGTQKWVKAPEDMVGWFQHHPYLDTEKPKPVTIGGVKGEQFEWIIAEDSPDNEVYTFKYSDGSEVSAAKGFKYRAIVLQDVKGETVTIGVGSQASEFDEFSAEAQKVLETVKWGGGGVSAQEEQAAKEQADKVRHIPEDSQTYEGEPLPAGHYVTEEFRPPMSFDLGKGWSRGGTELPDAWDLQDLENDAYWLVFTTPEEVYAPNGDGGLKIVPAPKDMAAWLHSNPYLKTNEPKPTSVGGEKGVQFDAIVTGAPESPECPGCPDLGLFHESAGATAGVEKGEKLRFIVLEDVTGKQVTIMVESSAVGFEEFLPKAQRVIKTVEWKGT
jgi:hypothetical protein